METGSGVIADLKNDLLNWETPFLEEELFRHPGYSSEKYSISRQDAQIWAVRDCKFLIFDDSPGEVQLHDEDDGKDYNSDDPEDELDWALGLSLELNEPANLEAISSIDDPDLELSLIGDVESSGGSSDERSSGSNSSKRKLDSRDDVDEHDQAASRKRKGKGIEGSGWSKAETSEKASLTIYGNLAPNYVPTATTSGTDSGSGSEPQPKERQCRVCSKWPEFPHNRKSRKFRLIRPRDEFPELFKATGGMPASQDICAHYVAVSYCWPPRVIVQGKQVETPRHYKVKDLDGKWRRNRALDDVLDRAVDVANTFGLRMIWIDQECLPQAPHDRIPPHKEDKELGIQAMDIIYNRAFVTSGLQDVKLSSQAELDLIMELVAGSNAGSPRRAVANRDELNAVMRFMYRVSRDRWYTRAWVVQEAISAGDNLCLVFRRDLNILSSSSIRLPIHRRGLPAHSLEVESRETPSRAVCLMVHEIRNLMQAVKLFTRGAFFTRRGTFSTHTGPLHPPEEVAFEEVETLHPTFWQPRHPRFKFGAVGLTISGIRPTTDAAGAVSLLKSRGCEFNRDRLAIIANMCGYEFRINGDAIPAHHNSLRLAILALSLLNGDFSLLVPEAYTDSVFANSGDHPDRRLLNVSRPGWIHPFDVDCRYLHHIQIRGFDLPRTHSRDSSPGALRIPAFLWKVDDKPIDMLPIKLQWEELWLGMKCLKTVRIPISGEDNAALANRMAAISIHTNRPGIYPMIKEELQRTGTISNDSPIWNGINQYAGTVCFSLVLMADRVEHIPWVQEGFTKILFGILRYLYSHSDEDPRAQGTANSIWQSIRVDMVEEGQPELPDTVCEELLDHIAVKETPFRTIKLDRNQHEYRQVWLIDQIMSHGKLWVGRYMRDSEPRPGPGRLWPPDFFERGPDGTSRKNTELSTQEYWEALADIHSMQTWKTKESLLDRQFRRGLLSLIQTSKDIGWYSETRKGSKKQAKEKIINSHVTPGAMVGTLSRIGKEILGESEDYRVRELVAIFNVQGPSTIAIPFDSAWEMIPHPSMRSMSVCWVVQHYALPERVKNAASKSDDAGSSTENSALISDASNNRQCIRVQDKVQGFWPIMAVPPWQNYTLV